MLGDVIFLLNIDISQSGSNEAFNCKHFLTKILLVARNYSNTKIGNTLSNIIYQATTEMETARRAGRELRWLDNRNQHHNHYHININIIIIITSNQVDTCAQVPQGKERHPHIGCSTNGEQSACEALRNFTNKSNLWSQSNQRKLSPIEWFTESGESVFSMRQFG